MKSIFLSEHYMQHSTGNASLACLSISPHSPQFYVPSAVQRREHPDMLGPGERRDANLIRPLLLSNTRRGIDAAM